MYDSSSLVVAVLEVRDLKVFGLPAVRGVEQDPAEGPAMSGLQEYTPKVEF